jgi:tetratricopeptide (TPR) repeat protein
MKPIAELKHARGLTKLRDTGGLGCRAFVTRPVTVAWSLMIVFCVTARLPADTIRTIDGERVTATVVSSTPRALTVEDRAGARQEIPVETILDVQFDDEPQELRTARNFLGRGRPGDAVAEIEKLVADTTLELMPLVQEELEFVRAAARSELALRGSGSIPEAGKEANDFLRNHPQSLHTYRMIERVGDLLAAAGDNAKAGTYYARLADGPPAIRIRAAAARGRMQAAGGDHAAAVTAFEEAEAIEADDAASLEQKREASLGRARSLGELGRGDEAVEVVDRIFDGADPADVTLLAAAYNALGDAHRGAGRLQDAIIAYLTVDLVYNASPEAHAEALSKLALAWEQVGQLERAREARGTLQQQYPQSRWARSAS